MIQRINKKIFSWISRFLPFLNEESFNESASSCAAMPFESKSRKMLSCRSLDME
jgi:hypothetical protein